MTVRIRIGEALRLLPDLPVGLQIQSIKRLCLCPGCYFFHSPGSEMCDRCALEGCSHEESRHA